MCTYGREGVRWANKVRPGGDGPLDLNTTRRGAGEESALYKASDVKCNKEWFFRFTGRWTKIINYYTNTGRRSWRMKTFSCFYTQWIPFGRVTYSSSVMFWTAVEECGRQTSDIEYNNSLYISRTRTRQCANILQRFISLKVFTFW